ncbi:hypothetical protein K0J45_18370 [Shewanella alkalitolerans]|uniref:hypothetical protein n=1 Tax=Shewanella alkalitolerans TaxID=2864209 RepID=UPI001C6620BE|nr:hypothetical protein [Shewanella alkalitolerans]QYJ97438.1 hypothetical protein K0J45_18370 [Shewanella alkalitolerans]
MTQVIPPRCDTCACDDADWCHLQETTKLLLLATAQIELSLTDGDHNVTGLGQLFTQMAGHLTQVNRHLHGTADTPVAILAHSDSLMQAIDSGVMAFQFYDRISQRLNHVITALSLMETMLGDEQRRHSQAAWANLQREIQAHYSLDCERQMFAALLEGVPIHQALNAYRETHLQQTKQDVELF